MNQHIMNQQEFDLWAGSYDKSVGLSDQQNTYPFAGYRQVLNEIYRGVLSQPAKTVLDIGFGTGVLTAKLYQQGCPDFRPGLLPKDDRNGPEKNAPGPVVSRRFPPMAWQSP